MTEPALDEHGHALVEPTLPGVVLVQVTHPDDQPDTCTKDDAKASQRRRWRCGRGCPAKGVAATPWRALGAVLDHERVCPRDPKVAAAREAARPRRKEPGRG